MNIFCVLDNLYFSLKWEPRKRNQAGQMQLTVCQVLNSIFMMISVCHNGHWFRRENGITSKPTKTYETKMVLFVLRNVLNNIERIATSVQSAKHKYGRH